MKSIMTLITILFLATSAFAAEISEADVKTFLNEWLAAQNTGSYSNYANMYADNFTGIRRTGTSTHNLNREAWLKDRKKMFKRKMVVDATNPEIKLAGTTAVVKFEQTWASGTYKDKGDKLLNLALENGTLKILKEEMLFSKVIVQQQGGSDKVTTTPTNKILNSENSNMDNANFISDFTSIREIDCTEVSRAMTAYYDKRQLDANECLAVKGWQLFTVFGPESDSWIDIAYGDKLWSTEKAVSKQIEKHVGYRPHIRPEKVEWRMTKTGEPSALIFRIHAQQQNKPEPFTSRLFIFSLKDNTPRYCGMAKTNEEAREIADTAKNCLAIPPNLNNAKDKLKNSHAETDFSTNNAVSSNAIFRNQHTSGGEAVGLPEMSKKLERYLNRYENIFSEYSSPKGWRLFAVYSQDYSWFDIVYGRTLWSTSNQITDTGSGSMIMDRVQWRMTKSGVPNALILRARAQDVDNFNKYISRLIIISLTNNTPRYCGMAKTNLEAYAIAEKASKCREIETKETVPQ